MQNEEYIEPRKEGHKRFLQKVSKVISIICLITAVISAIYLVMINGSDDKVLKASVGAIAFFCFTVGIVLNAIASANLPNLKIEQKNSNKSE